MARKIAVCLGQNTYAPHTGITPLRGCVNDALLIGEMLRKAGFEVRQVHDKAATQRGILQRLEVEVVKLRAGDYFVFWNSSHGYQLLDREGDELTDNLDEAICCYDNDDRDPLTDDKLARIISRADPKATVFFGFDSCHSGTVTKAWRDEMTQDDRTPRLYLPHDDVRFRTGSLVDLTAYLTGSADKEQAPASDRPIRQFGKLAREVPEDTMRHLLLSGCRSDQVSWDAKFPQGYHGAMTYHFARAVLEAWQNGRAITYRAAHKAAHDVVAEKFNQNPQLEGPDVLKDTPVFGYEP